MKSSICNIAFKCFDIKTPYDYVDLAKKYGFESIDLSLMDYIAHFDWMKASLSDVKKHFRDLKTYADKKGIIFGQTHVPYKIFPQFLERDFLKSQTRSILITNILGGKYAVFHPLAFPLYGGRAFDEVEFDYNIRFFNIITPYLKKYKIKAAIENIYDWDKPNIRYIQFSYPKGIAKLINMLPEENFVLCLDTGHLNMVGNKQRDIMDLLGKRLKVLHIHDNNGVLDQHILPGLGTIDWKDFTEGLAKIGFDGAMNLEIKSDKSYFPQAKTIVDRFISEVFEKRA